MKILGVDWGEKRIGLAISEGGLAEPLEVVGSTNELVEAARREAVGKIVLGLPDGKHRKRVERLAQRLGKELGVKVVLRSETLSTREAQELMISLGKSRKKRSQKIDSVSAALILQGYLDQEKMSS